MSKKYKYCLASEWTVYNNNYFLLNADLLKLWTHYLFTCMFTNINQFLYMVSWLHEDLWVQSSEGETRNQTHIQFNWICLIILFTYGIWLRYTTYAFINRNNNQDVEKTVIPFVYRALQLTLELDRNTHFVVMLYNM